MYQYAISTPFLLFNAPTAVFQLLSLPGNVAKLYPMEESSYLFLTEGITDNWSQN